MSVLLKFGGQEYFLDFDSIEKVLTSGVQFKGGMVTETVVTKTLNEKGEVISTVETAESTYRSREVDGFRYQTLMTMIEILLTTEEEEDIKGLAKQPISFKLAFNTLVEYGILNIAE